MLHIGRVAFILFICPLTAHAQYRTGMTGGAFVGSRTNLHIRTPNVSVSVSRVTVFRQFGGGYLRCTPFLPTYTSFAPFGGYPIYSAGYPYFANYGPIVTPPIVVDSQPQVVPEAAPPPVANPPKRGGVMPGAAAGRFRPVGPADRDRARQPVAPEAAPPPRPAAPDPKLEHETFVREGKHAFADGQYGRAAELFCQAIAIAAAPEPADADFFLGQSLFALGKYADATAAIMKGLAKQPDWPTTGPPLRGLYAGKVEQLSEHRRQLDDAAAANPSDVALEFLRAYVRWFDGEHDEGKDLFRRLRDRVAKPDLIALFLRL